MMTMIDRQKIAVRRGICRRQWRGFLLGLVCLLIAAGGHAQETAKAPIILMGDRDFPPYEFLDQGEPAGAGIDMVRALELVLDRPIEVHLMQWAEAQARVQRGEGHGHAFMNINEERKALYDFTQPVFTFRFPVFVRSSLAEDFDTSNLTGKRIAVKRGGFPRTILENSRPEAEMVIVESALEGFRRLLRGEVEGVIEEEWVGYDVLRRNGFSGIRATSTALAVRTAHTAVLKGYPDLVRQINDAITELRASGAFEEIADKWSARQVVLLERRSLRLVILWGLVGVALIVAVAGALYILRVRRINRRLTTEITERLHAEDALREGEERFRDMAESAADWFWEMGPDLRFTYLSERYFEITGFRPEEKIGTTRTRYVDPTDREADAEKWAAHLADLETHKPFKNFEYPFASSTGRVCHARISGTPIFDSDGEFLGYRGTGTDITERKRAEQVLRESEERFRSIIENSPSVITLKDLEGRFRLVNSRFEDRHQISAADVIGKKPHDVYPREFADVVDSLGKEVIASNAVCEREVDLALKDGNLRSIIVTIFPVTDAANEVAGVGAISTDVTEHRRAEEQLRQAQKMEAVGQLTAGVAHDFNNMLAVILGNAELLDVELGADNPQLAAVYRATMRATDLTQRLLAFSRKQVLNPEIINANNLIADITDLLRRTLGEHIDIEAVTAAGLWNCEVDPAQLENALVNLAINARDAMPDGGKLTIETANARLDDDYAAAQAEVTPGQYVMLAVADTGSGMPPEVRDHVFEPFFTTKAAGKGTGLGLSMVYGFGKQSGGHVTIHSEQGEGTTIKLYLPRSEASEVEAKTRFAEEVPRAKPGETVLVVEDDADLRSLVVIMLDRLGYTVHEAGDGNVALDILAQVKHVDLILGDLVLPGGMNGPALAIAARRDCSGLKVLYMTGYAAQTTLQQASGDSGAAILRKPFKMEDLARNVWLLLHG